MKKDKCPTEGVSMDKEPEENTEKWFKQTGSRLGKLIDLKTELNLARSIKGNKKNYYRYISDKRKTWGKVCPTKHKWEMWLLGRWRSLRYSVKFFASVLTGKCPSHTSQVTENKDRDWENEELPAVGEDRYKAM